MEDIQKLHSHSCRDVFIHCNKENGFVWAQAEQSLQ